MLQVLPSPAKSKVPALSALVLGAVAAYGAASWVLDIQSISSAPSMAPVAASIHANLNNKPVDSGRVAQALGAPASADAQNGNNSSDAHQWSLLGVVAGASGHGSALLAIDGQAPKAYLPGQTIAPGWVLHSVGHRLARLAPVGQEAATVTLELPKLTP
jgi:general secretion pathway protein C